MQCGAYNYYLYINIQYYTMDIDIDVEIMEFRAALEASYKATIRPTLSLVETETGKYLAEFSFYKEDNDKVVFSYNVPVPEHLKTIALYKKRSLNN